MEVKLYNAISPLAMKLLKKYNIKEGKPEIVIVRSADLKNEEAINDSVIVARAGVGVNNICVERLTEKLVPVVFAPGGNADSVAESTIGKIIDACKNTLISTPFVKTFEKPSADLEAIKKNYKGIQLRGSSICIIGLGNIGTRVAYSLAEMGMKVFIKVRKLTPEYVPSKLASCNGYGSKKMLELYNSKDKKLRVSESINIEDLKEGEICITSDEKVLFGCDIISTHIGAQKQPFFNKEFFEKVKKGSILINTDRGNLIDEPELMKALEGKIISSYHTDFAPENLELRKHPKCFSSPHTAATTEAAEDNCAVMVVESILNYVFDGNMINSKNFPQLVLERKGETRVVVFGKEVEESKVEEIINKFSILQSKKASNGKICYVVFDVKDKVPEEISKEIAEKLNCKCRIVGRNEIYEQNKKDEMVKEMIEKKEVFNFSAGPAILPSFVIENMIEDLSEFANSGMSVAEMSHRDKPIMDMIKETGSLIRELLEVPDNFEILFLQGGATNQFSMVPMNLSSKGDKIGYVEQGAWSKKAIADAKICDKLGLSGTPVIIDTNAPNQARRLPEIKEVPQDLKYFHICQNETIHGLEYRKIPDTGKVPLIIDNSSNIFSLPMDWSKNIGLIYAGAQKNSGIAGCTIVIIRKDLVDKNKVLPNYLKYDNHVTAESEYNTPPVVAILSINYMLKWLKQKGGVKEIEKINIEKAEMLYKFMNDSNGFYIPRVEDPENQSRMNVVFNMKTPELEADFIALAKKNNLIGLKGHRSLGGVRASIYNGFPTKGVVRLIEFMKEFQKNKQ